MLHSLLNNRCELPVGVSLSLRDRRPQSRGGSIHSGSIHPNLLVERIESSRVSRKILLYSSDSVVVEYLDDIFASPRKRLQSSWESSLEGPLPIASKLLTDRLK